MLIDCYVWVDKINYILLFILLFLYLFVFYIVIYNYELCNCEKKYILRIMFVRIKEILMFLNSSIVYVRLKWKRKLFIINGELVIIKKIYIYIIKKIVGFE